jgi:predicted phosphodiesterase
MGAKFRNDEPRKEGGGVRRHLACISCLEQARRERNWRGRAPFAVVLGDFHFPFHHATHTKRALDFVAEQQPRFIVQVGDLYDRFSQSRFPKSASVITPHDELVEGRLAAEQMWASVRARSPKSECYQLTGNHDDRPLKRILERAPELLELIEPSVRGLHEFPGVATIHDSREELMLEGVCFIHGWRSRLGDHANHARMNVAHGHSHHGGTWFRNDGRGSLWELDAGCLIDLAHPVFDYRIQKKLYGVTNGVGFIDSQGPRFIPFT